MTDQRRHVFVSGKVQGVFFRQALKVTAKKHNVTGWVRNLDDGRVEAVLEGAGNDVAEVVRWCHAGPANSRVADVDVRDESFTGEFESFEVLYPSV